MLTKTTTFDTKRLFCWSLAIIISGCNSDSNTHSAKAGLLAKVNGDEITTRQLDAEMKSAQLTSQTDSELRAQVLSKMIDRQLLAQESIKLNLDRLPEVADAVNSAKAQIYAQTYLAHKLSKLSSPDEKQIESYIQSHPEIFAHRKVFSTTDVIFAYEPVALELQSLQATVTDLQSLQAALDKRSIKYNMINGGFSMDAMPAKWAEHLKQVKVGDLLFTHDMTKVVVKSITNISENPMSDQNAKTYTAKMLTELKKQQFLTSEIARLRTLSQITIFDSKATVAN